MFLCFKMQKFKRFMTNIKLTDTDSTSLFFVFIWDLQCNVKEDEARNIIFEVMLKSKIFD